MPGADDPLANAVADAAPQLEAHKEELLDLLRAYRMGHQFDEAAAWRAIQFFVVDRNHRLQGQKRSAQKAEAERIEAAARTVRELLNRAPWRRSPFFPLDAQEIPGAVAEISAALDVVMGLLREAFQRPSGLLYGMASNLQPAWQDAFAAMPAAPALVKEMAALEAAAQRVIELNSGRGRRNQASPDLTVDDVHHLMNVFHSATGRRPNSYVDLGPDGRKSGPFVDFLRAMCIALHLRKVPGPARLHKLVLQTMKQCTPARTR